MSCEPFTLTSSIIGPKNNFPNQCFNGVWLLVGFCVLCQRNKGQSYFDVCWRTAVITMWMQLVCHGCTWLWLCIEMTLNVYVIKGKRPNFLLIQHLFFCFSNLSEGHRRFLEVSGTLCAPGADRDKNPQSILHPGGCLPVHRLALQQWPNGQRGKTHADTHSQGHNFLLQGNFWTTHTFSWKWN